MPTTDSLLPQRINFLRTTFAGDESIMKPALEILGRVLKEFFEQK